jgi:hypothetical protein
MSYIEDIEKFLINARTKTYAGSAGVVEAALNGSKQLEFSDGDLFYRDVFYTGENTFYGIETVFDNGKPVFGMSYFGNWGDMTEEETDNILRGALIANPETRLNKDIEWQKDGFTYLCEPDLVDDIEEIGGTESISKDDEQVYVFYYAGGMLVQ